MLKNPIDSSRCVSLISISAISFVFSFPFLSFPYPRLRSVLLHTRVHAYIVRYDGSPIERSKEHSIEIRFVRYLHILKLGVRNEEETHTFERYSPSVDLHRIKRNGRVSFPCRTTEGEAGSF